jgi:DNA-binding winged helix-turn-helix (wHTH) protein/Tol biopolymer transport system component
MAGSNPARSIIRFGIFQLDIRSGELYKAGVRLGLQEQPLQILTLLLQRPGELVTREELRRQLWPKETFGDFEHGLNAAVARLRETLGDSADAPRFVETLPRRGYRFIAPVRDDVTAARPDAAPDIPAQALSSPPEADTERPRAEHGVRETSRTISEAVPERGPTTTRSRSDWRRPALTAAVALAAVAFGAIVGDRFAGRSTPKTIAPPIRALLDVRPADALGPRRADAHLWTRGGSRTAFAWTPNARALVFVGAARDTQQLYVRWLDGVEAQAIAGTDGAQAPAVSPDGKWVAFWADSAIRRVPLTGGPVEVLESNVKLDTPPSGIAWAADGQLFYSMPQEGPIRQIGADGASDLTRLGTAELNHALPALLPGDQVLLYTVRRRVWTWGDEEVVAYIRATGATKVLLHDATDARYVPTGHLLFLRRSKLFAVPFDPVRLELRGQPVALLDDVAQSLAGVNSSEMTGAGQFAVASDGTLAWVPSPIAFYPEASLVFSDRRGHVTLLSAPVANYAGPLRVSPNGRQLAVGIHGITEIKLCLYDTVRGTLTPLTADGEANLPIWSPDGGRLVFSWLTRGRQTIAWQRVDGSLPAQVLMSDVGLAVSWLPGGRDFSVVKYSGGIALASLANSGKLTVQHAMNLPDQADSPEFSPDGHWLAYGANLSGQPAIYLQAYPGPTPRVQVSIERAAISPAWNSSGRELFYVGCDSDRGPCHMMVVDVRYTPKLTLGRPRSLFSLTNMGLLFGCMPARCYDVGPGGERFYAIQRHRTSPAPAVTHISLIFNWLNEVQAKVLSSGPTR